MTDDILDLKKHIRTVNDFPIEGIKFRDITSLIETPLAFKKTCDEFIKLSKAFNATSVASIESRGFIFAGSISKDLLLPFVLARKPGKLPNETFIKDFDLEYGSTSIEIQKNTKLNSDDRVIIVDDLIATGGTAEAAAKLVEISGGKVACFIFVINLFDLNGSDNLKKKGYKVENLIEFPGH